MFGLFPLCSHSFFGAIGLLGLESYWAAQSGVQHSGWVHPPTPASLHIFLGDTPVYFQLDNAALWLLFFGLCPPSSPSLGTASASPDSKRYWLAGLAATLLGALGVFGLQDTMSS